MRIYIISRATLESFSNFCLDWLADIEDCNLPDSLLGVGSAIRAKQLPGPLAIGSRDSPSLGYKQAPRPVQDLLAGKRGPQEFPLSHKVTTLDLWNNQPLTSWIEQKKSFAIVCLLRENIFETSLLPVSCLLFGKAIGRLA